MAAHATLLNGFTSNLPLNRSARTGEGQCTKPGVCISCGPAAHPPAKTTHAQCDISERREAAPETSRRFVLALTSVGVLTAALGAAPQAEAAGRRKPPVEEKKQKEENRDLNKYQAKLLESSKRKEAMKESVEARRAQAVQSAQ